MNDLDLRLELVHFSLHELLSDLGEEVQVEFDETALHDLLTELNGLFFALLHDFPKLVRKCIGPLVQFFLRLVILSQIWILIRKLVETLHELVKDVLLAVTRVQKLQELHLQVRIADASLLALQTNIAEDALHLTLVVAGKFTPQLDYDRLEVVIYVVPVRQLRDIHATKSAAER